MNTRPRQLVKAILGDIRRSRSNKSDSPFGKFLKKYNRIATKRDKSHYGVIAKDNIAYAGRIYRMTKKVSACLMDQLMYGVGVMEVNYVN